MDSKSGRKNIKNALFGTAIAPIDRGHQQLLIAEIPASNGAFLIIFGPCFDFHFSEIFIHFFGYLFF